MGKGQSYSYADSLLVSLDTATGRNRIYTLQELASFLVSSQPLLAETYSLEAARLSDEEDFIEGVAQAQFTLALIYQVRGEYHKSLEYNLEVLSWAEEEGDDFFIAAVLYILVLTMMRVVMPHGPLITMSARLTLLRR